MAWGRKLGGRERVRKRKGAGGGKLRDGGGRWRGEGRCQRLVGRRKGAEADGGGGSGTAESE